MEIDDQDGNLIKLLKGDPFLGSLEYLPFSAWYSHALGLGFRFDNADCW
jgi:hypothetical protein